MRLLSSVCVVCAFVLVIVGADAAQAQGPLWRPRGQIHLLQPPDDATMSIPASASSFDVFKSYYDIAWPWIIGVAASIGVLQVLVGGIQIMISGGSEQKEAGKTRLMWAIAGLLLVALATFILRTLNDLFYSYVTITPT